MKRIKKSSDHSIDKRPNPVTPARLADVKGGATAIEYGLALPKPPAQ